MEFWVRSVLGWALMVGAVAGFVLSIVWMVGASSAAAAVGTSAGTVVSTAAFLLGGWLFANRGREATDPGLPDPDSPLANPRPFGN